MLAHSHTLAHIFIVSCRRAVWTTTITATFSSKIHTILRNIYSNCLYEPTESRGNLRSVLLYFFSVCVYSVCWQRVTSMMPSLNAFTWPCVRYCVCISLSEPISERQQKHQPLANTRFCSIAVNAALIAIAIATAMAVS